MPRFTWWYSADFGLVCRVQDDLIHMLDTFLGKAGRPDPSGLLSLSLSTRDCPYVLHEGSQMLCGSTGFLRGWVESASSLKGQVHNCQESPPYYFQRSLVSSDLKGEEVPYHFMKDKSGIWDHL